MKYSNDTIGNRTRDNLFKVASRNSRGATEENHENLKLI